MLLVLKKKPTFISYEEIHEIFIEGVICIEDRRFFEHPGIDVVGMIRAFFTNLLNKKIVEGASTLTQQLVRQVVLTKEKSYRRKLEEVVLAMLLECTLTKSQILEFYLNTCFYGVNGNQALYGIAQASQGVFEKEVYELTTAEQAFLAALIGRPLIEASTEASYMRTFYRQHRILGKLIEQETISEQEYKAALREDIHPFNRSKESFPLDTLNHYKSQVIHPFYFFRRTS